VGLFEARFSSGGACELHDDVEGGLVASWDSVGVWARAWFDEWGHEDFGVASEFAHALTGDPPSNVVDVLVTLAEVADGDPELLGCVGAGPLEDLVSHSGHGERFLDDVEAAARQSPAFRQAITGVWLGLDLPEPIRRRLAPYGARDFVAEHAMTESELKTYIADRRARGWLGQGEDKDPDQT
jgi:hypothetical protein